MTADVRVVRDIPYAADGGEELKLDIHRPDLDGELPTVLYFHGGGWVAGDKGDGATTRLAALARFGLAVVSVEYRLAPAHRHPAQVEDGRAAAEWVRAHGAEFGLARGRVAAWGASAGGYIATMLGLDHVVDAVVGWFTLGDMAASVRRSALEALVLAPPYESALFGRDTFAVDDPDVRAANPLGRVDRSSPPFLLMHGDRDQVVSPDQGRVLHEALVRAGADSTFLLLGGAGHEDERFDTPGVLGMTAAWLRDRV